MLTRMAPPDSLIAALIQSGVPVECILYRWAKNLKILNESMRKFKFVKVNDLVEGPLVKMLPENAHQLCSGKLGITLSKIWSFEPKFVTEWTTKQELVDTLRAGCFIPVWSGYIHGPELDGIPYIDGGFADNSPTFNLTLEERRSGRRCVTISAFVTDTDIKPEATHPKWFNFYRAKMNYDINIEALLRAVYALAPLRGSFYKYYMIEGHRNMKKFLLKNNFIKCPQCYRAEQVQTFDSIISENEDRTSDKTLDRLKSKPCLPCLMLIEKVENLRVPEELIRLLDD